MATQISPPQDVTTFLNTPELAETGYDNGSVTLTWTNHSLVDTAYLIEQQTGPSTWTDVHDGAALTDDADTDSATISSLTEATVYNFRVTALGDSGAASVPAAIVAYTAPNDPSGINAQPIGNTEVDLTWTNNSSNADNVVVQRSADSGSTWSTIATVDGDATSYSDTTALEGTTYEYQVAAIKGTSASNFDTSSDATTAPLAADRRDAHRHLGDGNRPELDRQLSPRVGLHRLPLRQLRRRFRADRI